MKQLISRLFHIKIKKIILKLKNKSLPGIDSHIPLVPTERINVIRKINDVKNYMDQIRKNHT